MSNFFEDLTLGRRFRHAAPRTITEGEIALYIALTGARQPIGSSAPLARALGFRDRPIDDVLLFNIAFGKTVADISFNARGNLGYADLRFVAPVYPGDTIRAESDVIGRRETSSGDAGVVYVRTQAFNQHDACVLDYVRWVLVRKSDPAVPSAEAHVPDLPPHVTIDRLAVAPLDGARDRMFEATGCGAFFDAFQPGDRIDHEGGITIDESDHTLATKLYQNNAIGHFDALAAKRESFGRRIVYGGHVISLCRALSYAGLENVVSIAAINAGTHVAPTFAGDTIYAASEVVGKSELPGRSDAGAIRLRLWGLKNRPPAGVAFATAENGRKRYDPAVVLDLDYTVVMPR